MNQRYSSQSTQRGSSSGQGRSLRSDGRSHRRGRELRASGSEYDDCDRYEDHRYHSQESLHGQLRVEPQSDAHEPYSNKRGRHARHARAPTPTNAQEDDDRWSACSLPRRDLHRSEEHDEDRYSRYPPGKSQEERSEPTQRFINDVEGKVPDWVQHWGRGGSRIETTDGELLPRYTTASAPGGQPCSVRLEERSPYS